MKQICDTINAYTKNEEMRIGQLDPHMSAKIPALGLEEF